MTSGMRALRPIDGDVAEVVTRPNSAAVVVRGDAHCLPLADDSVDLIVTSPPYFALRSYQDGGEHYAGQIGDEGTAHEFLDALWSCTREWLRVLKPCGSIFVNLGDKYVSDNRGSGADAKRGRAKYAPTGPGGFVGRDMAPQKSLMMLPARYAIGCVDQLGLIQRAEIVWDKPNGMPESVTDRVQRSHEQWFHFTAQPRYYSAVDELRERHLTRQAPRPLGTRNATQRHAAATDNTGWKDHAVEAHPLGKLPGSVWTVATEPLKIPAWLGVEHYAPFPTEWPRRLILGWSPPGICVECGEGRRPQGASSALDLSRPQARRAQALAEQAGLTEEHLAALLSVGVSDTGRGAATQSGTGKNTPAVYALAAEARAVLKGYAREYLLRRPTELVYVCACPTPDAPTSPAVVLDPFGGTGTTALAASVLGRVGVTVDLSGDYCRVARWRTTDPGERARAMRVEKPPVEASGQASLFGEATA